MKKFDANDPQWTAFALGELTGEHAAPFEATVVDSDEAREFVAEVRAMGALLETQLESEPMPELTDVQREAIDTGSDAPGKVIPMRWKVAGASAFAAAAVALVALGVPLIQHADPAPASGSLVVSEATPSQANADTIPRKQREEEVPSTPAVEIPAATPDPTAPPPVGAADNKDRLSGLADGAKANELGWHGGVADESDNSRQGFAGGRGSGALFKPSDDYAAKHRIGTVSERGGAAKSALRKDPWADGQVPALGAHGLIANKPDDGDSGDAYAPIEENAWKIALSEPLSTFSVDVDTASYANVRRYLTMGQRPPADAIRVEELINYFDYDYPQPTGQDPFAVATEVAPSPWNPGRKLVRIGLQGRDIDRGQRPSSNLVFLIDVSGSMASDNKLGLLKRGLGLLVENLNGNDRVAIEVYAGASGLVLQSTPGNRAGDISDALNRLRAGGSTNGGAGIELAYQVARQNYIRGGSNRVILCTDGDFNVGVTNRQGLVQLATQKAKSGVFLTVLGFGMGNYKDATLEQIANKANGAFFYIDNDREARKVLVDELSGTLVTIAKDVKIQVEFNPARVKEYRLVGYENRKLAHRDFNDDTKDAGEIGAGHRVTALYEIVPVGFQGAGVDPLRYQQPPAALTPEAAGAELMTLKLRYKEPDGARSKLLVFRVEDNDNTLDETSAETKFAAAVAGFGLLLRGSPNAGDLDWGTVLEWADVGRRNRDPQLLRAEFVELVRKAQRVP